MTNKDVQRIRKLQAQISKLHERLLDAVIEAARGSQKISIEELELEVSRLDTAVGGRVIKGSRQPLPSAGRAIKASRRPLTRS